VGCDVGNRTLCLCITLFVFLVPHAAAKHAKDVQKLPFKLYRNHLVITTGTLGGIERRNLLIDTGASPTVVDEALAYELGLKPIARPPGGMNVVGGVVETYYAILKSFDLGPIHRESIRIVVANLSLMQAEVGVRIDAIVGLDMLKPNDFQIDYDSRKINFGSIRASSWSAPMAQIAPFVIIETQINGTRVNLAVDTGTSQLVLFQEGLPDSIATLPVANRIQLSNVAGDIVAPEIQLANFTVGNRDLSGSTAVLATVPECCEFQGVFGISALRFKRISFDFQHRLLGLDLPDTDDSAFLSGSSCGTRFAVGGCRHVFLVPGIAHLRD
jgi:predicted aspartyl protease